MKKFERAFFILILLCSGFLLSAETADSAPVQPGTETAENVIDSYPGSAVADMQSADKNYLLAIVNSQFSNLFLFSVNRFIGRTEFSKISIGSIRENFSNPWQWDQSQFVTNQLGHPYQGSFYYVAGRANNLNLYESALLTVAGSLVWEIGCERSRSSLNDLIVTTFGGISLGEILHRLFLEVYYAGSPLAFILSPMDGFNMLVSGTKPPDPGRKIHSLSLTAGGGYALAEGIQPDAGMLHMGTIRTGVEVVYGSPFDTGVPVRDPFSHFELTLNAGGGYPLFYDVQLFTDGMLFSFVPLTSSGHKANIGMSLLFDCIWTGNVNFSSAALAATAKYRYDFTETVFFESRFHAGWMMLGASNMFIDDESAVRNYGTGCNVKMDIAFCFSRFGTLRITGLWYGMVMINTEYTSYGDMVSCTYAKASYSIPLTDKMALGISDTFIWEESFFSKYSSARRWTNSADLFLEWKLI
ncbi:DUF3943 domain-containing protein [Brucepastera parasyntrophica]|uniref:DUF3943 domain-containing protein n=1 Tax=Brucepastera parasyntrophica TaxID=2880008 RepID=UPI00210CC7E7|nr:DUF3943 domain-containing protein [Brucepastera parasyntrophica]ULQ60259.1 DUF3943 domain-containing protein [Brucepastera parasyntrophica]